MSSESSSSAGANPASKASANASSSEERKQRTKPTCFNCGAEGHTVTKCTVARDDKRIHANANAARTQAALAEKARQAAAEKAQREFYDAKFKALEARIEAQSKAQQVIQAPAVVDVVLRWRDFVDDDNIDPFPAVSPAAEAAARAAEVGSSEHMLSTCALPPNPGPKFVKEVCDIKVLNFWEMFWYTVNFLVSAVLVLLIYGSITALVVMMITEFAVAVAVSVIMWASFLLYCWKYRRENQSDFTRYTLIGSAYPSRDLAGDRRHITFKTCPIDSPSFIADAKYMTYKICERRNGRYTEKLVTISHELLIEASAPKNEGRYVSAKSMESAYSDTLSFLKTHGHVNLDRDLQADEHILHNTAKFYVFKLKVDLFNDEVSTNLVCP